MKKGNVLEIKDLSVDFMTVRGIVYAVQGVDLEVKQGEIHGIVGAVSYTHLTLPTIRLV